MTRIVQRVMHCPCGNSKVLALGLCSTCYTLKRQDEEYFGGLREAVLERDGYRCRVCDASGRDKRSIIVHHRVPGKSLMSLMLSLCPGCHAKVHRTKVVFSAMPPLLLELWREQHPKGHEQVQLDFTLKEPAAKLVPLFAEERSRDASSALKFSALLTKSIKNVVKSRAEEGVHFRAMPNAVLENDVPAIRFLRLKEDISMPQCSGGGYMNLMNSHPSRAIIGTVKIVEMNTSNVRTENCLVLPNAGFPLGCTFIPGASSWTFTLLSATYQ